MYYNRTSAALMLQTIMVLMDNQNSTHVTNYPGAYDDAELERCYDIYGCFSKGYPWTEHRPDNYFPVPPEAMAVQYPVFTRRNRKLPVLLHANNKEEIKLANLDPRGPFYLLSHGFLEGGHKAWIQQMADELLNLQGNEAATVIIVDWRGGSQPPYGQAVANIRLIGVMTSHLVHDIYEVLGLSNLDNFHYIGHSLGAHLGGYCGHDLQKRYNLKLGRISGLDPAAPYFSKTVSLVRLDRSDAKYVDIIHSNAIPLYLKGFGISEAIGHVDFYPNGGSIQPGCQKVDPLVAGESNAMYPQFAKYVGCNHERSYEYFIESINPSCPFSAIQCESYEAFEAGNCTTCGSKHQCMPLGYHSRAVYDRLLSAGRVDSNSNIALYSLTGDSKPYCRVHYKIVIKVSNSSASQRNGPERGRLSVLLVDRRNNSNDHKYLDDEPKYYRPGDMETKMVAIRDTGLPPLYAFAGWHYTSTFLDMLTRGMIRSPSLYLEYLKLSSIEYNTDITLCPISNKPVVDKLPIAMKTKYCDIGN